MLFGYSLRSRRNTEPECIGKSIVAAAIVAVYHDYVYFLFFLNK